VLAGHSYVVSLEQGALVLADAAGHGVSDPEKRELSQRLTGFGKPDPFLDGIENRFEKTFLLREAQKIILHFLRPDLAEATD